ncbi:GIY-YIG nuclease family protein [Paenibacillus donghaensis]|uniref:DNA helicase UvrC n=1 Tax=Paenibacillus donghaensis TaxID=414771 RepID=A0A2Z2KA22_9BACL|nr:GIY-YIG nuclease family protein [Paenibacillus donghaensis]ASA19720.1 DNA helicase UvrC [Paenibacillus donghaensis]
MNLTEKVQSLPLQPGVYLMKDSLGHIIYVGKAKSLKKRVQSYFYNNKGHSPKVKRLVSNIRDLEYRLTDTEFEAFMLECRLIKELKPMYNRKMKNPLAYTYISIRSQGGRRQIGVTGDPSSGGEGLFFGPYTSRSTVERAVQGLKEHLCILCSGSRRPGAHCLNYSLGLCMGVCAGGEAVRFYEEIIDRVIALLDGTDLRIMEEMEQRMNVEADRFHFEAAAALRDSLGQVRFLVQKKQVIHFAEENRNIAIVETMDEHTLKLLLVKGSRLLGQLRLESSHPQSNTKLRDTICTAITETFGSPSLIEMTEIGRNEIDEAQIIYSYLTSTSVSHLVIPDEWLVSPADRRLADAVGTLLAEHAELSSPVD